MRHKNKCFCKKYISHYLIFLGLEFEPYPKLVFSQIILKFKTNEDKI